MRAYIGHTSAVENDYPISMLHRRYTLRNDYLCNIRDIFGERTAYRRIGGGIHRARRVVEDNYLRLFKQCACDTETLLLSAGDICSALTEHCFIALGEGGNELVRLSGARCFKHLLV